jgi:hypothetical protein
MSQRRICTLDGDKLRTSLHPKNQTWLADMAGYSSHAEKRKIGSWLALRRNIGRRSSTAS